MQFTETPSLLTDESALELVWKGLTKAAENAAQCYPVIRDTGKDVAGHFFVWIKQNVWENPPALIATLNAFAVVISVKVQTLSAAIFEKLNFNEQNARRLGAFAFAIPYLGMNYVLFKTSELSWKLFGLFAVAGIAIGTGIRYLNWQWIKRNDKRWTELETQILGFAPYRAGVRNQEGLDDRDAQRVVLMLNWNAKYDPFNPEGRIVDQALNLKFEKLSIKQMEQALVVMEKIKAL